jgi:urea transport system substrate-binding protein
MTVRIGAVLPLSGPLAGVGVQAFVDRVRRAQGADAVVSAYVMTHHNALIALKAGLERSGEIGREAAVEGMAGLTYQIPTGHSWITGDHHAALSMYIARTERGAVRVVEPLGLLEPSA